MKRRFERKRAVVTGAGSDIGAVIARNLLVEGAIVAAVDAAEPTFTALTDAQTRRCIAFAADTSDEDDVAGVLGEVAEDGLLDHVFNVAGIASTTAVPRTSVEVWDRMFFQSVRATLLMCKYAIPIMAAGRGGSIVNTAWLAEASGSSLGAASCGAAGALIALSHGLAVDHAVDGVRVNCLCLRRERWPWLECLAMRSPNTESTHARQTNPRSGARERVAAAALYLAGDDAAHLTGSAFAVQDGWGNPKCQPNA